MKIGYIRQNDIEYNPNAKKFDFLEATFTRKISSRGDRIYSKLLAYPVDYEDVKSTAETMKENKNIIIVREPFLLDDELRNKVKEWVEWANTVSEKEYDPFS